MEVQKHESLKPNKIKFGTNAQDPESLTHYFGNDDYREGNRIEEAETDELDGFSAQGNNLQENQDNKSDMPEFKR